MPRPVHHRLIQCALSAIEHVNGLGVPLFLNAAEEIINT